MSFTSFTLVCEDPSFAEVLQCHLSQFLKQSLGARTFEAVSHELGPSEETLVLAVTHRPRDVAAAKRLIQEIALRHWPARVLLVTTSEVVVRSDWDEFASLIIGRYVWHLDGDGLEDLAVSAGVQATINGQRPLLHPSLESVPENA